MHRDIQLPYSHLLFSERETAEALEKMGKSPKYTNWLTPSTYLVIFTRVGFEVVDVKRHMNSKAPAVIERVIERFPLIHPRELMCSDIDVRLIKPIDTEQVGKSDNAMDEKPSLAND